MKPLGDDARSLIAEAEHAYDPTTDDKARVRAGVSARIAGVGVGAAATVAGASLARAGATTTSTAASSAVVSATAATQVALTTKLVAALLVATSVGGGIWVATRPSGDADHATLPPAAASVAPPKADPAESAPRPAIAGDLDRGAKDDTAPTSDVDRPSPARKATPHSAPPPRDVVGVAPAPAAASVATATEIPAEPETTLIKRAESSIDAGDGLGALASLDAHARAYPRGLLADRRDALRVVATCTIGRVPAAREQAARYLDEHPRSPEGARIRRVCGTP